MKKIILTALVLVMLTACAAEAVPAYTEPEPVEAPKQVETLEPPTSLEAQPAPTPPRPSPPEDVTPSIEFPHPLLPPPIFYDPPPPPFVPHPVEISEFGRQVATEFLSEFHSIFSFGFRSRDGSYSTFTGEVLDRPPLVWYGYQDVGDGTLGILPHYFDRYGNRIEGAIFAGDDAGQGSWLPGVVFSFSLYYFGNDGIPDILILSGIPETCASGFVIYSFIDGEYRDVGTLSFPSFFFDYSGQVVVLDLMRGMWDYFYLDFTPDGAELTRIPLIDWDVVWAGDNALSRQFESFHNADFWESEHPTMFNSNLPLTHIRPLTELQEKLTESITANLLADFG